MWQSNMEITIIKMVGPTCQAPILIIRESERGQKGNGRRSSRLEAMESGRRRGSRRTGRRISLTSSLSSSSLSNSSSLSCAWQQAGGGRQQAGGTEATVSPAPSPLPPPPPPRLRSYTTRAMAYSSSVQRRSPPMMRPMPSARRAARRSSCSCSHAISLAAFGRRPRLLARRPQQPPPPPAAARARRRGDSGPARALDRCRSTTDHARSHGRTRCKDRSTRPPRAALQSTGARGTRGPERRCTHLRCPMRSLARSRVRPPAI